MICYTTLLKCIQGHYGHFWPFSNFFNELGNSRPRIACKIKRFIVFLSIQKYGLTIDPSFLMMRATTSPSSIWNFGYRFSDLLTKSNENMWYLIKTLIYSFKRISKLLPLIHAICFLVFVDLSFNGVKFSFFFLYYGLFWLFIIWSYILLLNN